MVAPAHAFESRASTFSAVGTGGLVEMTYHGDPLTEDQSFTRLPGEPVTVKVGKVLVEPAAKTSAPPGFCALNEPVVEEFAAKVVVPVLRMVRLLNADEPVMVPEKVLFDEGVPVAKTVPVFAVKVPELAYEPPR